MSDTKGVSFRGYNTKGDGGPMQDDLPPMSMVERVARALFQAFETDRGPDPELPRHPFVQERCLRDVILDGHFDLERATRAAIEAMREPSEEMVRAGEQSMPDAGSVDHSSELHAAWPTMIDAALK